MLTNCIYFFRVIQESFINMENMIDLMKEPIEVQDVPHAPPLVVTKGKIEFRYSSLFIKMNR